MDADALTCTGTAVKTIGLPLDDGEFAVPALEIRRGMRCTLLFHVFNYGDSDVELDTVTVEGVGPAAGAGVRAVELSPLAAKPRQEDEHRGTEALFFMDSETIEAGTEEEFGVVLEYHRGCTPPGDNISFRNSPLVKTEDGVEAAPSGPAYAFVSTKDTTGCGG